MQWYVFRDPQQGGPGRLPKIVILAHLGHFRGSTLTPLKDPQTPHNVIVTLQDSHKFLGSWRLHLEIFCIENIDF